jgi:hypothetical protein
MSDSVSRRAVLKNIALMAGTVSAVQAVDAYAIAAAPATSAPAKPAPKANPAAKPPTAAAAPAAAPAAAGGLPHLEETDPAAKALGYVSDVKKVDPKSIPTHQAGAQCSNCVQLQGKAGDEWRPCNMFPKKLVHQTGWCKVYSKKVGVA